MSLDINLFLKNEKYEKVRAIMLDPTHKFIIIDGIIGAGKTTLISKIESTMGMKNNSTIKVKAIYEPVELWNSTGALQYFYKDITKNCYEFQTYTYITRINTIIDEIYNCPDADVYILERSIFTDRYIFMELLRDIVGEMRMTMYEQWCDIWAYIMPITPNKWVLLNTSLETSLKRIESRNRDGETNGISVEYQTNLYNKHIEFYEKLKKDGKPVVIIDSETMDIDFLKKDNDGNDGNDCIDGNDGNNGNYTHAKFESIISQIIH